MHTLTAARSEKPAKFSSERSCEVGDNASWPVSRWIWPDRRSPISGDRSGKNGRITMTAKERVPLPTRRVVRAFFFRR